MVELWIPHRLSLKLFRFDFCIDNAKTSAGGEYVVYQTSQDVGTLNGTSIWTIKLHSHLKGKAVRTAENNDIIPVSCFSYWP